MITYGKDGMALGCLDVNKLKKTYRGIKDEDLFKATVKQLSGLEKPPSKVLLRLHTLLV